MIGEAIDRLIGVFSPAAALRRTHQRHALKRMYAGAEASRLTANKKPQNLSADSELLGPFGADALRAWARNLVRDNAYAWGVVDTIVSSVVGCGITAQSQVETPEGDDVEDVNDIRDAVWQEWCEVCDVNGRFNFAEIQQLVQREMVEAGEVLLHIVRTPSKKYRGIHRPVPLALELIEADRLAADKDTYQFRNRTQSSPNKVIRGVELDEFGKAVGYWIYPEHPRSPYATRVTPERYDAADIIHLYRADRIGQSRGVSWFAPVMTWLRDLGLYVDNEMQASAVASCFGVAITTNGRAGSGLMPSVGETQSDDRGNQFEHLEPAMIVRLNPGESVESINPGRPNSASDPWIGLMLRGISVGTGLSYELVSRDYRGSSYSTSRTSQLEDRRRFRRWQAYLVNRLCNPVWDRFNEQAATAGIKGFPTMTELLDNRRAATAVEWHVPVSEWVDPQNEQAASDAALNSFQSTYQDELGARGKSWRQVFYQRAKEEKLKRELGLVSQEMAATDAQQSQAQQMAQQSAPEAGSGEMSDMSRLQWSRNRKAIEDVLAEFIAGTASEAKAKVFLQSLGLTEATATMLIDDASDGTVDTDIDTLGGELEEPVKRSAEFKENDHPRADDGKFGSGGGGNGKQTAPASGSESKSGGDQSQSKYVAKGVYSRDVQGEIEYSSTSPEDLKAALEQGEDHADWEYAEDLSEEAKEQILNGGVSLEKKSLQASYGKGKEVTLWNSNNGKYGGVSGVFFTDDDTVSVEYAAEHGYDTMTELTVTIPPEKMANEERLLDAAEAVTGERPEYAFAAADNKKVQEYLKSQGIVAVSFRDLTPNNAREHGTVLLLAEPGGDDAKA